MAITITECIAGAFSTVVAFKAIGSESGIKKTLQKASAFNASVNLCHKIMTGYYDSKTVASYRKEIATIEDGHKEAPSNLEWKMFLNDVKGQISPSERIITKGLALYKASPLSLNIERFRTGYLIRTDSDPSITLWNNS